jgi:hypothetical protein
MMNKKDEKEEKLEKLEGGFNCYVNGAHKSSARYTPRHTTAAKSSSSTDKRSFVKSRVTPRSNIFDNIRDLEQLTNKDRCQSAPSTENTGGGGGGGRKKWSNDSFTIKTNDGYEIKINAPNATRSHISKSDTTYSKVKAASGKTGNKKHDTRYSEDFESESDREEETIRKVAGGKVTVSEKEDKESESANRRNLIQSVKFSDVSDESDSEETKSSAKVASVAKSTQDMKMEFRLSSHDIKLLRQSINQLNFSSIRDNIVRLSTKIKLVILKKSLYC